MALKLVQPYLKQGNKTYYLRGTVRGEAVFEFTKTTDKKAAESIRVSKENRMLNESIYGRAPTITLGEAVGIYLDKGGSKRFLGKFNDSTGKWEGGLIGHFGEDRVLHTINQDDLDEAAKILYPNTLAATRNRQCHAPFIAIYNRSPLGRERPIKWERPTDKKKGTMQKFKARKVRAGTTATTYDRAFKFVLAMSPAPAMLMTTFFYTGMRPIELFTLEEDQVNVAKRWITLPESKTGEPRGVPMHEVLVPLFTGLMKRGGFLFRTHKGMPYEPKDEDGQGGGQMKSAINGARQRSDILDIAPYTGRHTVSSHLVMNNVSKFHKDQIMGHAKDESDTSRRYVHLPQLNLIEAINTLPVIEGWAKAPWMLDPLAWSGKLVAGTGRRTDLIGDGLAARKARRAAAARVARARTAKAAKRKRAA